MFGGASFLRSLGGGCQFPIAAHGVIDGELLKLDGLVAKPDGSEILRDSLNRPELSRARRALGAQLADQLRQRVPEPPLLTLLNDKPLEGRTVVVTRAASQAAELTTLLEVTART
jgi:hypothetical protein